MIIKWIKKEIEKERAHKAAEEKRLREERDQTIIEAQKLDAEMEDKFCPIIQGKCRKTCVNFEKSVVSNSEDVMGYKYYFARKPKCKLWRK